MHDADELCAHCRGTGRIARIPLNEDSSGAMLKPFRPWMARGSAYRYDVFLRAFRIAAKRLGWPLPGTR